VCRAGCKEGLEHVLREEGTDTATLLNQRNKVSMSGQTHTILEMLLHPNT